MVLMVSHGVSALVNQSERSAPRMRIVGGGQQRNRGD